VKTQSNRKSKGQVLERERDHDVVFALRFYAYGKRRYLTLGGRSEGWTRERAEVELQNVLADVRRGIWQPDEPVEEPQPPAREPTFHEFASEWLQGRQADGLSERTIDDLRWSLEVHLLPHFAGMQVQAMTVEDVDRYRRAKVREGRLSASSINKTLRHLSAVLGERRGVRPHRAQPGDRQAPQVEGTQGPACASRPLRVDRGAARRSGRA